LECFGNLIDRRDNDSLSSQIDRAGDETEKGAGVTSVDNRLIQSDKHQ
jgi:hypothetical protein